MYGASPDSAKGKYSPAECIGARKIDRTGNPDKDRIGASFAERRNLNMWMHMDMRRFTRLTNAFGKKVEKPRSCGRAFHDLLQLRPYSQNASGHACDGGWRHGQALGKLAISLTCRSVGSLTAFNRTKIRNGFQSVQADPLPA
jgi:hypothetical protein